MEEQFKHWAFCQKCGRVLPVALAKKQGWLVSPLLSDPTMNVVRCFRHITEHSLRVSRAGRTTAWRKKMADGREKAAAEGATLHPFLEPAPLEDHL